MKCEKCGSTSNLSPFGTIHGLWYDCLDCGAQFPHPSVAKEREKALHYNEEQWLEMAITTLDAEVRTLASQLEKLIAKQDATRRAIHMLADRLKEVQGRNNEKPKMRFGPVETVLLTNPPQKA